MKKSIFILFFVLLFSISAFADGEELSSDVSVVYDEPVSQTVVYSDVSKDPDYVLTDISIRSVSPVDPSDTSGLKAALLSVLGSYDPIVVEYAYTSSQGYVSYLREVQYDWVWLASAAFLFVFIYCLFRLGGALLDR